MYTIQKHLNYHSWANGKLAEILNGVDETILDTEVKSSFNTVRKTLYHMWDAEVIWMRRIKGEEVNAWPSQHFTGSIKEALSLLQEHSKMMAEFFKDKDSAFLERKLAYKNMKGLEFTTPIEEIMFHLVNHASFHRGQMVTMLRELGVTQFTPQDLIAYVRQL